MAINESKNAIRNQKKEFLRMIKALKDFMIYKGDRYLELLFNPEIELTKKKFQKLREKFGVDKVDIFYSFNEYGIQEIWDLTYILETSEGKKQVLRRFVFTFEKKNRRYIVKSLSLVSVINPYY